MSNHALPDAGFAPLPVGSLTPNALLKLPFPAEKQLPGDLPVLSATIDAADFSVLQKLMSSGMDPTCFSSHWFGGLSLLGELIRTMTLRFQIGTVQFYWLAEMSDPVLWRAIQIWGRYKKIPIIVRCANESRHFIVAYSSKNMEHERIRRRNRPKPHPEFLYYIRDVLEDGYIESLAATDIPGTSLDRVIVNVLVSPL
ncbi:hypothetical protein AWB77_03831 [Caballeronia fortuita]|uniref:Uncharacterized protein n=1 Tax=Caballeronia fortuita TaxID=1777138 RepID=A0A158CBX7_9BURK|nr:hypothetical protein AWB77_03831 [Caballeronia fortuita]